MMRYKVKVKNIIRSDTNKQEPDVVMIVQAKSDVELKSNIRKMLEGAIYYFTKILSFDYEIILKKCASSETPHFLVSYKRTYTDSKIKKEQTFYVDDITPAIASINSDNKKIIIKDHFYSEEEFWMAFVYDGTNSIDI